LVKMDLGAVFAVVSPRGSGEKSAHDVSVIAENTRNDPGRSYAARRVLDRGLALFAEQRRGGG